MISSRWTEYVTKSPSNKPNVREAKNMSILTTEATYQHGVIEPSTALPLQENERIWIQIERRPDVVQKLSKVVRLRGIWKGYLTTAEKEEDWVSDTVAAIRHESSQGADSSHCVGRDPVHSRAQAA
jgi:hypothetical protein